jgi:hypothetical protein
MVTKRRAIAKEIAVWALIVVSIGLLYTLFNRRYNWSTAGLGIAGGMVGLFLRYFLEDKSQKVKALILLAVLALTIALFIFYPF